MIANAIKPFRRNPAVSDTRALRDPVITGAGCGLIEGTLVGTPDGWTPIETLARGDEVMTFDAGFQKLTALVRDEAWHTEKLCPRTLWPLLVPAETLDNRQDMLVMPHQGVLIECEDVSDKWGDPYAVVPGAALDVLEGVERQEPYGTVETLLPVFEHDQMVFANHGLLMFCQSHWGVRAGILPRHGMASNYNMLPVKAARALLEVWLQDDV
ncbi:Hint domain-containing protein [Shimia abyssi]|uniref:Hint domain-containing protein n=1 Tax=Shimia abyssi TaxID=1662395 RepID=A0A2P8FK58_9RHOB|nr:Hint domain-containing protein [Shimia abyssi]PSL22121.1 Hint domain-containing protein [Shimia abyssi]